MVELTGEGLEVSGEHREWMARDEAAVLGWRYNPPVVFERAQGLVITDVDGRDYLDATSGMMSLPLGHSHPELTEALVAQAGRFVHHSSWYSNSTIIEFAERLCSTLPAEFGRVNFAVTGSEANEVAMRMARAATGRSEFVSAFRGLHGGTLGMETITNVGGPRKRQLGPLLTPTRGLFVTVPFAYRPTNGFDPADPEWVDLHLAQTREHLELTSTDDIAGIILETVMIAGGFVVPPRQWLQGMRRIADDYGALLILDEAQLAPGRTGTMWCFEQFGVLPDIITFAKGMGAGLPVCGAIATHDVAERAIGRAGIPWGGTFTGDPLAAAVALRQLEIVERDNYPARASQLGAILGRELHALSATSDVVGDVRGLGMYFVLDIVADKASRTPAPDIAEAVRVAALEEGVVLIVVRNFVRLCPSLVADESDLVDIVRRLAVAIERVEQGYRPDVSSFRRASFAGL